MSVEIAKDVVRHLVKTMGEFGWTTHSVWDGEVWVVTQSSDFALGQAFMHDVTTMQFVNADGKTHSVFIVFSEGSECLLHYSYSTTDTFDTIYVEHIQPFIDSLKANKG